MRGRGFVRLMRGRASAASYLRWIREITSFVRRLGVRGVLSGVLAGDLIRRVGFYRRLAIIEGSGLFDAAWYRAQYPDVPFEEIEPAQHYLSVGAAEGRDPGPGFDTSWYVRLYPDVAQSGANPLVHYVMWGAAEGRLPRATQRPAGAQQAGRVMKDRGLFQPDLRRFRPAPDALTSVNRPTDFSLAVAVVVTYNHLHAALNLIRSIRATWSIQPKIYVALIDQYERARPGFDAEVDVEIVRASALDVPDFWWQAAKFTPVDFCCVVKPYVLRHVLARGHATVVYCDADLHFFDDARALVEHVPDADLVLVPHMMSPFPLGLPDERPTTADIANAGMMNGGLFVVRRRPASTAFLETWGRLCLAPGNFLPEYGYQSEQQALNWAFAYLDNVAVFRDPCFNVAYWNLHERPVRWSGLDGGPEDVWTLDGRPLVCFHFSGLAWSEGRLSRHENRHHLSLNVNLWALCRYYERRLLDAQGAHYGTAGYEYGEIEGWRLRPELRAELRRLECFDPPVMTSWMELPDAFREATGLIGRRAVLPLYLERILDARPDLQRLDDDASPCRLAFLGWAERWLWQEYPVGILHERSMERAFNIGAVNKLAVEIAHGPFRLTRDAAAGRLVSERLSLLEELRRHGAPEELLETIEAGAYRHPAFEPALCIRVIYAERGDLRQAFPDPLGWNLPAFRRWLQSCLAEEYLLPRRVRDFVSHLDPAASLARVLAAIQQSDVLRSEISRRGLGAWAFPPLVEMLPNAPGYDASDLVIVAWWLEQHAAEAHLVVGRTFVSPLASPAAGAYLEWWCTRNVPSLRREGLTFASGGAGPCADGMREFVDGLRTALARLDAESRNGDHRTRDDRARTAAAGRFAAACETARMELRRPEAREMLAPHLVPDPRGINVFGYFRSPIGLGTASVGLARALERAGYRAQRVVLTNSTMDVDLRPEDLHPNVAFNVPRNLVVTYPHIQYDNFAVFPPEFFEGRETSAYIAWEQRDVHPSWAEALRRYDRLFAISSFTADAVAAATGRPCEPIPCAVEVDRTASQRWPRESFGIARDRFVVGLVFDATSSVERKNPLAAVRAVGQALAGRDVLLVVKVSSGDRRRFAPTVHEIAKEVERHRLDHLLITEFMPKRQVDALIASFDLYVSLHRAEGFGFTMAEAMMLGVPVIATAYSGNMDFMTKDNAYLVSSREEVVRRQEGPFQLGTVWAEPDVDEAVEQCRRVYERPAEAKARADRARIDVEGIVSVEAVARRLKELFD